MFGIWTFTVYHGLTFIYRAGYFFSCFDLSTSGKSSSRNFLPSLRVGHLRARVLFNEPLPVDLTMLIFCEIPSTLFIGKTGKMSSSFLW